MRVAAHAALTCIVCVFSPSCPPRATCTARLLDLQPSRVCAGSLVHPSFGLTTVTTTKKGGKKDNVVLLNGRTQDEGELKENTTEHTALEKGSVLHKMH